MNVFLEIKNIKKHFGEGESRVEVLKGIDIEIEKGEFCVLLGPSGSGKSTLLNLLGGMDTVTSGDIIIDKENISCDVKNSILQINVKTSGNAENTYAYKIINPKEKNYESINLIKDGEEVAFSSVINVD